MRVVVHENYSGVTKTVEGSSAQVEQELLRLYPWLRSEDPDDRGDVPSLVEHLDSSQAYSAEVEDNGPELSKAEPSRRGDESQVVAAMLGHHPRHLAAMDAARFLAGGRRPTAERARQALWEADGDEEEAALLSHDLEVNEKNLAALRAVLETSKVEKAEGALSAGEVVPGHPDAQDAAEAVRRAFDDGFVVPVKLGGKHSAGSMLARDQVTNETWLLKPGSGQQSPAAGARQDPSTQSRREAVFWHVAEAWGLGDVYPRADLVVVDGREYAAIRLLPWDYRPLDKVKKEDPNAPRALLQPYLKDGALHRWAVLDFVLANPDRHAGNLMEHDGDVKLIDHGSAMAGTKFDPAHDHYSFTPFYLRAWAPGKFSTMAEADKLKYMPRLDRQSEEELRAWIEGLHATDLDRVLLRYGVDPAPAKERLAMLKTAALREPADLALNKLWVEI